MPKAVDAITIESVSKLFRLQKQKTFKEFLPALVGGQSTSETFWALKNISFSIKKGESFGIIGPNGSGKSTLLKLMAGVTQPTKGRLEVHGKIAPLIELGAGFHSELTGRENVYLNGVILGRKRQQIEEDFASIVAFSELADFIDQPIKHYSSGMYLRLAFSVAIHTNPDVLLVDEILTVGDASFQEKSRQKMDQFHADGKTIVIVSHSLSTVAEFCDRAAYINKGKLIELGPAQQVIDRYTQDVQKE